MILFGECQPAAFTIIDKKISTGHFCTYHDSHCDIQPRAQCAHLYCNAYVDSAFYVPPGSILVE